MATPPQCRGSPRRCPAYTVLLPAQSATIGSLAPTGGLIGAVVSITGTNFGATQGSSAVTFNGTAATPMIWSDTSITVPVPAGSHQR